MKKRLFLAYIFCLIVYSFSFTKSDEREPFLGLWKAKCLNPQVQSFNITKHPKNKKMLVITFGWYGNFTAKVNGEKFTIEEQSFSAASHIRISGNGKLKGKELTVYYESHSTQSGGGGSNLCDLKRY